jgi:hypothetical protein
MKNIKQGKCLSKIYKIKYHFYKLQNTMDGNNQMNKKILIITSIIIVIIILSGCQEQKAVTAGEKSGQIKLRSSVVELYESSYTINNKSIKDDYTNEIYEIIESIEVKYLFKNIAGKPININVSAEFYDKNDKLVDKVGPREINLPENHTEKVYTLQNSIIYSGSNVADVQYVLLIVEEKV